MLKIEQVNEIIAENKLKNKVASLEDYAVEIVQEPEKHFNNAMGQESLTRFDQPKKKKKSNKKRKPGGENVIVANKNSNNDKQNNNPKPNVANDKKNPIARKPIIITKNENKE
jgi:hypothetical protein